jgi:hypothetical protein
MVDVCAQSDTEPNWRLERNTAGQQVGHGGSMRGRRTDTREEIMIKFTAEDTGGSVRRTLEESTGAQVKLITQSKEWNDSEMVWQIHDRVGEALTVVVIRKKEESVKSESQSQDGEGGEHHGNAGPRGGGKHQGGKPERNFLTDSTPELSGQTTESEGESEAGPPQGRPVQYGRRSEMMMIDPKWSTDEKHARIREAMGVPMNAATGFQQEGQGDATRYTLMDVWEDERG